MLLLRKCYQLLALVTKHLAAPVFASVLPCNGSPNRWRHPVHVCMLNARLGPIEARLLKLETGNTAEVAAMRKQLDLFEERRGPTS